VCIIKKEVVLRFTQFQKWVIVAQLLVMISLVVFAINKGDKKPITKSNSAVAVEKPRPLPLTRLYSEEDGWVVKSDLELVDKTQSLMVAEIHGPKDVEGNNHLGFLDTRNCTGMNVSLPHKGQKIKVMFIDVRVSEMNNYITDKFGGGPMFFIRPSCTYY